MADKKTPEITLERTYNIPLRREYLKVQNWRRTEKAVTATREFLKRHMKAESIENVKLGQELNEELWKHGLKNPPHHVKVTVTKDKEGLVRAELFGRKKKEEVKGGKESKEKKKEIGEKKAEAEAAKAFVPAEAAEQKAGEGQNKAISKKPKKKEE